MEIDKKIFWASIELPHYEYIWAVNFITE